ncbi:MAG: hypothetical protein WB777_10455 [Mycobacterium sp.]
MAIDFQFECTADGKDIKLASMIDEPTRRSPLHVVERSLTCREGVADGHGRNWFLKR